MAEAKDTATMSGKKKSHPSSFTRVLRGFKKMLSYYISAWGMRKGTLNLTDKGNHTGELGEGEG